MIWTLVIAPGTPAVDVVAALRKQHAELTKSVENGLPAEAEAQIVAAIHAVQRLWTEVAARDLDGNYVGTLTGTLSGAPGDVQVALQRE